MNSQVNKGVEKLLNKLVQDYGSGLPPEERYFKKKDIPAYIYNLYNGNYQFSYNDFKQLIKLMEEKSLIEGVII